MEVESSHNARFRGASGPPLTRPITMSHLRGITTKSFRHFRHLTNHVPKRRDAGFGIEATRQSAPAHIFCRTVSSSAAVNA